MKPSITIIVLMLMTSGVVWAQGKSQEAKGHDEYAQGKYSQAIPHYQRALDKQKGSAQAELNLLRAYLHQERHDDALKLMERLDGKHGQKAEYLIIQGDFFRTMEDWETARAAFEKALKRDHKNAGLYLKLGQTLSRLGDDEAAEEAFAQYELLSGN